MRAGKSSEYAGVQFLIGKQNECSKAISFLKIVNMGENDRISANKLEMVESGCLNERG
ncbi:hypothetical protein [Alkalihalobacillus deserti]|uniref:hypothetical protein n=1 Tax=Alkalihalobacillus deserti TaxID=2879466 RepID=UPI001D143BC1|nr:hypothetical protein [Alkalihalobacillus deserti]